MTSRQRRRALKTRLNRGFFQYFARKSTEKQPKWAYLSSLRQNQGGKIGDIILLER
jgi:hypothetical protein